MNHDDEFIKTQKRILEANRALEDAKILLKAHVRVRVLGVLAMVVAWALIVTALTIDPDTRRWWSGLAAMGIVPALVATVVGVAVLFFEGYDRMSVHHPRRRVELARRAVKDAEQSYLNV